MLKFFGVFGYMCGYRILLIATFIMYSSTTEGPKVTQNKKDVLNQSILNFQIFKFFTLNSKMRVFDRSEKRVVGDLKNAWETGGFETESKVRWFCSAASTPPK